MLAKMIIMGNKFASKFVHFSSAKISCFHHCFVGIFLSSVRFLVLKVNPLWNQLCYFISISFLGYLILKNSKPRDPSLLVNPNNIDIFFTSVSALTGSSMSTVEMEAFSNFQLIIMTILMFVGGEVFISLLGLQARSKFYPINQLFQNRVNPSLTLSSNEPNNNNNNNNDLVIIDSRIITIPSSNDDDDYNFKYNSVRLLVLVVLGYILVVHVVGTSLVALYISLIAPSAKQILDQKGLQLLTFSIFTTVSTFSNCGFVPTNENMMVFKKNALFLLILFPQGLFGNTLYPSCLRLVMWVLKKITRRQEFDYILRNSKEMIYRHLLSKAYSCYLAVTVFGFILVQLVLFCAVEWNSEAMEGLNCFQKIVASLFQVVNSRHTGESVFDISIISSANLVLFVVMMYLPPYTAFLPSRNGKWDSRNCKENKKNKNNNKTLVQNLIFSQLSYLGIFIILICITERDQIKQDPLNFNVFNITLEVISAYGNVGFSSGYSCKRQLRSDRSCKDAWYGFVGRWSNQGKVILILVMFFGRIKKFNMKGGKAWKLS